MLGKSNTPTITVLRWCRVDFDVAMADGWPCAHCFEPLRPSAVRREPGVMILICEGCHGDLLRVELPAED